MNPPSPATRGSWPTAVCGVGQGIPGARLGNVSHQAPSRSAWLLPKLELAQCAQRLARGPAPTPVPLGVLASGSFRHGRSPARGRDGKTAGEEEPG